jgi:hypothetical protein
MSCLPIPQFKVPDVPESKIHPKIPKTSDFPIKFLRQKGEYQNHPKIIHRITQFNLVDPKCVKFAQEKVLGVPLTYFYHIFTWVCAGIIAFDPNGDRLVTDTCRQVERSGFCAGTEMT